MECLLEVEWDDPIAAAVDRILSSVPEGMEQTTRYVPLGRGRAFVVYRSESAEALHGLARAIASVGAQVWVIPVAGSDVKEASALP